MCFTRTSRKPNETIKWFNKYFTAQTVCPHQESITSDVASVSAEWIIIQTKSSSVTNFHTLYVISTSYYRRGKIKGRMWRHEDVLWPSQSSRLSPVELWEIVRRSSAPPSSKHQTTEYLELYLGGCFLRLLVETLNRFIRNFSMVL